jgi:hypothetical protein
MTIMIGTNALAIWRSEPIGSIAVRVVTIVLFIREALMPRDEKTGIGPTMITEKSLRKRADLRNVPDIVEGALDFLHQ